MRIRMILGIGLVGLLTLSIWTHLSGRDQVQAQAGPQAASAISASEVAAMIAKAPADRNALGQRMLQLGTYSVNMEHRVMGQAASVHEKEAELFYVIEGSGTMVTGGKLVEEKRTNATNLSGTSIEGGVTRTISKGDWVMVPEGVPHQIPAVQGGAVTVMTLHLPR